MPDELTMELLRQLKEELQAAIKDKESVLVLDVPLDQPPPEHEPGYEEITIGLDVQYPPPGDPSGSFSYLGMYASRLFGFLFNELTRRNITIGDTRPPWGEPIETTLRFMLDVRSYPILLSATPISPDHIRLSLTVSVDPDVL